MRRRSDPHASGGAMKRRSSFSKMFRSGSKRSSPPTSPVMSHSPKSFQEVDGDYTVKVLVRKKPCKPTEKDIVEVQNPDVYVHEEKVKVDLTKYMHRHEYKLDGSFGENDTTQDIYDFAVADLVANIFDGGTSTTFCFGQTASGKTFTLFGASGGQFRETEDSMDEEAAAVEGGLYLLAAKSIFERAAMEGYTVRLSMYEIYGSKLFDLLDKRNEITPLEDGKGVLQLVGLSQVHCDTLPDFLKATNRGRRLRSTASTGANATSSRSHGAMVVRIYQEDGTECGKLSLIDLAGSERGVDNEDTDATTRREGRQINQSLLALKEVIRSMQNGTHAPFRQDKLTQVLEESLTGKHCQTVVLACISGTDNNAQHTINTLRYAQDCRPSNSSKYGNKSRPRTSTGGNNSRQISRSPHASPRLAHKLPASPNSSEKRVSLSNPRPPTSPKGPASSAGRPAPFTRSQSHSPTRSQSASRANSRNAAQSRRASTASHDVVHRPRASPLRARGSGVESRRLTNELRTTVEVVVRKRPTQEIDKVACLSPNVHLFEEKQKVDLTKYTHKHEFSYDHSFGEDDDTKRLYDACISGLVDNIFEGGTSTAFCFGQTASGKTFTLFGASGGQYKENSQGEVSPVEGGLYLLAAHDIFVTAQSQGLDVALSMYEIYGSKLFDLLDRRKEIVPLEDGNGILQLVGLSKHRCEDLEEFLRFSNRGRTSRSTASTGANATSSRSHAAMIVRLFKEDDEYGKLSLIDLAGSERGVDNEDTDALTRREGRQINTSLLALKEVIRAMQNGTHAPFRQDKLTQVLEESLTGRHCRTVVIACISGSQNDSQHTLNTLRYAQDLCGSKGPSRRRSAAPPTSPRQMTADRVNGSPRLERPPPPTPTSSRGSSKRPSSEVQQQQQKPPTPERPKSGGLFRRPSKDKARHPEPNSHQTVKRRSSLREMMKKVPSFRKSPARARHPPPVKTDEHLLVSELSVQLEDEEDDDMRLDLDLDQLDMDSPDLLDMGHKQSRAERRGYSTTEHSSMFGTPKNPRGTSHDDPVPKSQTRTPERKPPPPSPRQQQKKRQQRPPPPPSSPKTNPPTESPRNLRKSSSVSAFIPSFTKKGSSSHDMSQKQNGPRKTGKSFSGPKEKKAAAEDDEPISASYRHNGKEVSDEQIKQEVKRSSIAVMEAEHLSRQYQELIAKAASRESDADSESRSQSANETPSRRRVVQV